MELILRFDLWHARAMGAAARLWPAAIAGPDAVELHTRVPLDGRDMTTHAQFTIREGDSMPFTLSYHRRTRRRISCRTTPRA